MSLRVGMFASFLTRLGFGENALFAEFCTSASSFSDMAQGQRKNAMGLPLTLGDLRLGAGSALCFGRTASLARAQVIGLILARSLSAYVHSRVEVSDTSSSFLW